MVSLSILKPRERLKYYGVEALSIHELIMILLRQGTKNKNISELALECLNQYETLDELSKTTIEELERIEGIGNSKACELIAAIELGKRLFCEEKQIYGQILNSKTFGEYLMANLGHYEQEVLVIFCLNIRNQIISQRTIFIGSTTEAMAYPREIFHYAIKHLSTKIVMVHNHPSGNCTPSHQDFELTKRIYKAGQLLGIELLDHFIVSAKNYISLKEEDIF